MVRLFRRGRLVAARKRRPARVARRRVATGSFAKKVMAVLNRQEETKYVATNVDATGNPLPTAWFAPPALGTVGSFIPAIPVLGQGVGDYQRVGNKVSPISLMTTLKIGFDAQNMEACSLIGVIYYGTTKTGKTWNNANPLPTPTLLDNGDGTNSTWAGLRNQLNLPVDSQMFNVKRITFRLSKSGGAQNNDVIIAPGPTGNLATSNGMSEKSFVLRFKAPKTLSYNLTGDTYPTNYAPFYAVTFCHADASNWVGADQELVNVSSRVHMRYKDA